MSLGVGVVDTGAWAKRLWPGVKTWYGDKYAEFDLEYPEIFNIEKSDKLYEEYISMAGTGLAVTKQEGQPVTYASFQQGFTTRLVNVVQGLGFIITHEVQADDQYTTKLAQVGSRFLAKSMRQTKEQLGANVLNNGFSSDSTHVGGDGVSLFNTAHPTISGATYQNRPTADADFSEAALEQMVIDLGAIVDEAGLKAQVRARKLIVPRQLQFTAERTLKTPLQTNTANNNINAFKMLNMMPEGYRINHYLTGTKAWFVLTDVDNGLVMIEREGVDVAMDNDFDTGNLKTKITERYFQSYVDARGAYGVSPA